MKIFVIANQNIGIDRAMLMTVLAFDENRAELFGHAVIIMDGDISANALQNSVVLERSDAFGKNFFPTAGMKQNAVIDIKADVLPTKLLLKVLPNHVSVAEQHDFLAAMFSDVSAEFIELQLHVLVERVKDVATEHGKADDTGSARGRHSPIFFDELGVENDQRQAFASDERSDDVR